jgi:hypothetical protein
VRFTALRSAVLAVCTACQRSIQCIEIRYPCCVGDRKARRGLGSWLFSVETRQHDRTADHLSGMALTRHRPQVGRVTLTHGRHPALGCRSAVSARGSTVKPRGAAGAAYVVCRAVGALDDRAADGHRIRNVERGDGVLHAAVRCEGVRLCSRPTEPQHPSTAEIGIRLSSISNQIGGKSRGCGPRIHIPTPQKWGSWTQELRKMTITSSRR